MSELSKLYATMMEAIYGETSLAVRYIVPGKVLSAAVQLGIYQGSVKGGLVQALGNLFPASKGLLGEQFFDAMASRYVALNPSRSASLDHYGEAFPLFMKDFEPLAELPYMPDLASLEWTWHLAFHAASTNAISPDVLAGVPLEQADQLQCILVEPVYLHRSDYPLLELRALGLTTESEVDALDIASGGGGYVICRDGLNTQISQVSPPLYALLEELKKSLSFGTICAQWLSKHPDLELNVYTAELIKRSWIADFRAINH